jgi:hypothetical protein
MANNRVPKSEEWKVGRDDMETWRSGIEEKGEVEARGDRKRGVAGLTGKRQGESYR